MIKAIWYFTHTRDYGCDVKMLGPFRTFDECYSALRKSITVDPELQEEYDQLRTLAQLQDFLQGNPFQADVCPAHPPSTEMLMDLLAEQWPALSEHQRMVFQERLAKAEATLG